MSLPAPCSFLVFLVFDRSLGTIVEPPARPCLPLFTIHPRLMVLSNCIHQNLGFYCVARPTIFHPIVMSRLLRYFQVKLNSFPPDGIIIHMLMILHSIAWGSYLACGVLWVLGQKLFAWLAFLWWSPPSTGNMIRKFYRRIVEILFRGAILSDGVVNSYLTKLALSADVTERLISFVTFDDTPVTTIVLDNSATGYICNDRSAFVEYFPVSSDNAPEVVTVNGKTTALGIGTVQILWNDDHGAEHSAYLYGVLHFPDSPVNLLGVGQFCRDNPDLKASIQTFGYHSIFRWGDNERFLVHPDSNLPELPIRFSNASGVGSVTSLFSSFMTQYCHAVSEVTTYTKDPLPVLIEDDSDDHFHAASPSFPTGSVLIEDDSVFESDTSTPTAPPRTVTWADRDEVIPSHDANRSVTSPSEPLRLSELQIRFLRWHERLNHLPMAQMMKLAETGRLPKSFLRLKSDLPPCGACLFGRQHRRPRRNRLAKGSIRKAHHDHPGAGVSTDQLISHQPGLVPQSAGKPTNQRITAATVFVDHFSDFVYVALMTDMSADSTLKAKQEFEAFCGQHDVRIRHYHADNGRFADDVFQDDIRIHSQSISFCAVGHHAQNGIVEKKIGLLTESARTMLLHAERLWPEAISTVLWPFALKLAAHIHNHCHVSGTGSSPASLFMNTSGVYESSLEDFHTFGSPCYVLDSRLHSGIGGVPKWEPRASLRIYVGLSPLHSTNVAMVLNPYTGLVSPQYHVVFDDHFLTLEGLRLNSVPESWTRLCESCQVCQPVDPALFPRSSVSDRAEPEPVMTNSGENDSHSSQDSGGDVSEPTETVHKSFVDLRRSGLRRSSRTRTPNSKYSFFTKLLGYALLTTSFVSAQCPIPEVATIFASSIHAYHRANLLVDSTLNSFSTLAYSSLHENNEVYTFREAMNQDDSADFVRAMVKEVEDHESRNHWTMVPRSETDGKKTILSIWSFKRKRSPSGELLKHKARLCAHGGMQKWGESYWETYSPTVNWLSVRALLAISLINNLSTSTVDFTLAFPQVDLDIDVFMELPTGMVGPDGSRKRYVLKLNKSLYGLKQASHNWFMYLCNSLENRGYVASSSDKCVFFKEGIILLIYVDDILIIGQDDSIVNDFKKSMQEGSEGFVFTDGGSVESYLGVQVEKRADGSLKLYQPFLIDRIIKLVMGDRPLNSSYVPAGKDLLHKDVDGPARKHDFNYRQVVGMLSYLQGTTRPDISTATHACARFCTDPKLSHEKAIIKLLRYLVHTRNEGLIIKPDKAKGIECFVDASFAPGWKSDDADNATNLLSRTGYVIMFAGCPVHWSSKMQTEIALSTAEAEYIALSQAMREVIPFMRLIAEISVVFPTNTSKPMLFCKVFEDNEACISMVNSPKFTPRTKHIALKYHHFRSWVDKGLIQVIHIGTTEQTADIFTKPLERDCLQ